MPETAKVTRNASWARETLPGYESAERIYFPINHGRNLKADMVRLHALTGDAGTGVGNDMAQDCRLSPRAGFARQLSNKTMARSLKRGFTTCSQTLEQGVTRRADGLN